MSDRNKDVLHHTEDKVWWLRYGEKLEESFVALCEEKELLDAAINPEKKSNPMVPDLVVNGRVADLKTQNTPFFTSQRYNVDPRFAVTFNRKDYERYRSKYPEIDIYFWLDWTQTEWRGNEVEYLGGIFRLSFAEIAKKIENGAPEHHYLNRKYDTGGNAKSSFIFDIREFESILMVENRSELA